MSSLGNRLYRLARGRPGETGPVDLPLRDVLGYLWRRGGTPWLRGLLWRPRLGACRGRLLVGRRVQIRFPRYVSVGYNVSLGDETYVSGLSISGVRIADHVRIREHVWIQATATLDEPGVGVSIGERTYVGPRCTFGAGGGLTIGRRVLFGAAVHLLAENHQVDDPARAIDEQGVTRRGITIEDEAWIGNAAIVLDGVTVGRGAVIGAGAVVTRDVPPMAIAVGNPARVIRRRGEAHGHRTTGSSA